MRKTDKQIKQILQKNTVDISEETSHKIDILLDNLPEKEIELKPKFSHRLGWKVAFAMIAVLFLLPNLNPQIALAMQSMPLFGKFFEVITIRNYQYMDDFHEADIDTPEIVIEAGFSESVEQINTESKAFIDQIIKEFKAELKQNHYFATYVKYYVICDTEAWFTLKLEVSEVAASSNQYYKYYHIDKTNNHSVILGDLFEDNQYIEIISKNIYSQMVEQMDSQSKNGNIVYWIDTADENTGSCYQITPTQNFYFDSVGNIVIVFDKYVVGPGSMGCPEFTIPHEIYSNILK